ncbi:PREDICTED: prostaglandin E synthase [Prunus dulcis]|uniref:PREDICTED: prostaglandin E synthase n=1 Tax=Prunus dulcis TaxID=3755 RepID=A0A5E4FKK7_PRUDU|nr:PREDICTED: prostaglandin E synthase [Prunus dulcis]
MVELQQCILCRRNSRRSSILPTSVRAALYEAAETWVEALKARPFLGGSNLNLADLSVYGVLRTIEHLKSGKDMIQNMSIGEWYIQMERAVGCGDKTEKSSFALPSHHRHRRRNSTSAGSSRSRDVEEVPFVPNIPLSYGAGRTMCSSANLPHLLWKWWLSPNDFFKMTVAVDNDDEDRQPPRDNKVLLEVEIDQYVDCLFSSKIREN